MPDPTASVRLRWQLGLGGLGALVWYAGVITSSDFTSGLGVGVLISALALRLLVHSGTDAGSNR